MYLIGQRPCFTRKYAGETHSGEGVSDSASAARRVGIELACTLAISPRCIAHIRR